MNSPIFPDVQPDAWFYPYVQKVFEQGLMQGYPNGSFGAWDPVNRAELAKIILDLKQSLEQPWWQEHFVEIILILITILGWTVIGMMMNRIASRPIIIKSHQEHHQPPKPIKTNDTLLAAHDEKEPITNQKLEEDFEHENTQKNQRTNWWI